MTYQRSEDLLLSKVYAGILSFTPIKRGSERDLNLQLVNHLRSLGFPEAVVEVPLPTGGKRADVLVGNRIIIEAKKDLLDLGTLASLKEKLSTYLDLKGYKTVIVIYGKARPDLLERLKRESFPYPEVAILNLPLEILPIQGPTVEGETPNKPIAFYRCPNPHCSFEMEELPFRLKSTYACTKCGSNLFQAALCETCGSPLAKDYWTEINFCLNCKAPTSENQKRVRKYLGKARKEIEERSNLRWGIGTTLVILGLVLGGIFIFRTCSQEGILEAAETTTILNFPDSSWEILLYRSKVQPPKVRLTIGIRNQTSQIRNFPPLENFIVVDSMNQGFRNTRKVKLEYLQRIYPDEERKYNLSFKTHSESKDLKLIFGEKSITILFSLTRDKE